MLSFDHSVLFFFGIPFRTFRSVFVLFDRSVLFFFRDPFRIFRSVFVPFFPFFSFFPCELSIWQIHLPIIPLPFPAALPVLAMWSAALPVFGHVVGHTSGFSHVVCQTDVSFCPN